MEATAGVLIVAALVAAWLLRRPAPEPPRDTSAALAADARNAGDPSEEALRLHAAGQFPTACERLSRVVDREPSSALRREDLGRCFEGWGWQALRDGRADEAILLFRQGLRQTPSAPPLLKGLGVAAIHAGRSAEALRALEQAVSAEFDPHAALLLARLYDQRDEPREALRHLRAVLEREPTHEAARSLLEKVERERRAESEFRRDTSPHFLVKYRAADGETRRRVVRHLETAWERLGAQLHYRPVARLTVVLYEEAQFRDVTRVHRGVTGLFDGKIRLPVGGALPPDASLERLVVHEYAHAAIHDLSRGRAPRWLQEGLAQVLEGAVAERGLRAPGTLTVAALEALVDDADPARARAGYDIALWVVEDLLNRRGMGAMRDLLVRLGRGETIAAATASVYGVRLGELESQWRHLLGG